MRLAHRLLRSADELMHKDLQCEQIHRNAYIEEPGPPNRRNIQVSPGKYRRWGWKRRTNWAAPVGGAGPAGAFRRACWRRGRRRRSSNRAPPRQRSTAPPPPPARTRRTGSSSLTRIPSYLPLEERESVERRKRRKRDILLNLINKIYKYNIFI